MVCDGNPIALTVGSMTLKIRKTSNENETVLRISGRINAEHLSELQSEIATTNHRVVLDLEEVNLVDRDAIRFLIRSEQAGVELRSCPLYVREWIRREKDFREA